MNEQLLNYIATITGADAVASSGVIQSLWSGYGEIIRVNLEGDAISIDANNVVVKYVSPPTSVNHPRGWNTDRSHQRKLHSYQVEKNWYQNWANKCGDRCRVPHCYATKVMDDEVIIVMEDLDQAGYPVRKDELNQAEVFLCLQWLANFHATFLGVRPEGLWSTGTYWHLATRPDEYNKINDKSIKKAASKFDLLLSDCRYQTVVHGDAKVANFCFSTDSNRVAAVDFQYVGGGCGMKDVAYFIGSCMHEEDCEKNEKILLDYYFSELQKAMEIRNVVVDFEQLEQEWRALFVVAWTDFYRFLLGWMPTHWKVNAYSRRLACEVIAQYTD